MKRQCFKNRNENLLKFRRRIIICPCRLAYIPQQRTKQAINQNLPIQPLLFQPGKRPIKMSCIRCSVFCKRNRNRPGVKQNVADPMFLKILYLLFPFLSVPPRQRVGPKPVNTRRAGKLEGKNFQLHRNPADSIQHQFRTVNPRSGILRRGQEKPECAAFIFFHPPDFLSRQPVRNPKHMPIQSGILQGCTPIFYFVILLNPDIRRGCRDNRP